MKKNVASQVIGAQMVSESDGSAFTGAVTVYVTGDGGTQAIGSVGSGACTHKGNGFHTYGPAQAETNYDHIGFTFIGTGAIPATIQVYPSFPQTGDAFARIGAPVGASISADVAAVKTQTAAIETDTQDIQTRLPAALVGGRIDANMGAISGDSVAADNLETAFDDTAGSVPWTGVVDQGTAQAATSTTLQLRAAAGFADDELIGAVITITGGSGGVGQSRVIVDYVSSTDTATVDAWTTTPSGTITYKVLAGPPADATAAAIKAVTDKLDTALELDGSVYRLTTNALEQAPSGGATAAAIADAVWDEAISGHLTSGSTGEALNAAGAAGDPWITSLPGSYSAGQAGYILGTNLNATVSSRLATAGYTAPLDAAGTRSAIGLASANLDTQLGDLPTNVELATALGTADDAVLSAISGLTIPTAIENADALLARDLGSGSNAGTLNERTVRSALRFVRNKWAVSGTTLTVTKEDDSTTAWTGAVTASPGADPISGNDPT